MLGSRAIRRVGAIEFVMIGGKLLGFHVDRGSRSLFLLREGLLFDWGGGMIGVQVKLDAGFFGIS